MKSNSGKFLVYFSNFILFYSEDSSLFLKNDVGSKSAVNRAQISKQLLIDQSHLIDVDFSSFSTSMIILSILAVPLLLIVIIVSIVRLRQRGTKFRKKVFCKLSFDFHVNVSLRLLLGEQENSQIRLGQFTWSSGSHTWRFRETGDGRQ